MVQAAMALAAQSPLQLTAALGVPVTAVTRQPDVFVTVVPPQPEDKSWVYILVGVLGTLVAVLAVGFVLYRRKMQRKKRGDAPHITTAYKQTHRHDDRSGLTRGDDLPDLPEYEEPGLTKEQQWLQVRTQWAWLSIRTVSDGPVAAGRTAQNCKNDQAEDDAIWHGRFCLMLSCSLSLCCKV